MNQITKKRSFVISIAMATAICYAAPRMAPAPKSRSMVELDGPPGAWSVYPSYINNVGLIVGGYWTSLQNDHGTSHFFRLIHGRYCESGNFSGINDKGEVVADDSRNTHPMIWSNGRWILIAKPSYMAELTLYGLNNKGQLIGCYSPVGGGKTSLGVLYDKGIFRRLYGPDGISNFIPHAMNDRGQIVGEIHTKINDQAFLIDHGKCTMLTQPPGRMLYASGINNSGAIVGYAWNERDIDIPFLYSNGKVTLPAISTFQTNAHFEGINDRGDIIGWQDLPVIASQLHWEFTSRFPFIRPRRYERGFVIRLN